MESLSYNFEARSFVVLVVVIYFFLSLTLYCLSVLRRSQQARENGCEQVPTYPHIDPILGLDALYRSLRAIQRGHVMEELDSRFNTINGGVSTFSTVLMGSKILHTIEPENIKTILSTRSKDYHHSPGRKAAFGYFGPGIFINDGPEWELSRAMLRPSFTKTQVRNLPALEEHVHNLIARIPKEGQTIDLQPLFLQLTNDTIFETLMGESTYTLLHSSTETKHMQVADAVEYVTEFAAFRLRIGPLASLWLGPKFRKSMAYINNYVSDHVSRALASQREKSASEMAQDPSGNVEESQKYNFLKELVKTHQNSDRIQAELLHVLGAGRETTAALLSVLCYTVARRPDILQKLRKEIVQQVGDNKPTYNDVREMKYLKWTISETQRLYPVVPINSRVAIVDTILPLGGGTDGKSPVFVKAGTAIQLYPYSMHRRKAFFGEDALEFRPERWEGLENPGWNYIPFSAGPHICPGQEFALTEVSYTMVRLLQTFRDIRPADDSEWAEKLGLALAVRSGCKVCLTAV